MNGLGFWININQAALEAGVSTKCATRSQTAQRIEDDARRRADALRQETEKSLLPLRQELCSVLSLSVDANNYEIHNAVSDLKRALSEHPAHTKLRALSTMLRRALDQCAPEIGIQ